MFSTSFVSVESPRLTKFCDLFVKVGVCALLGGEVRTGHGVPPQRKPQEAPSWE